MDSKNNLTSQTIMIIMFKYWKLLLLNAHLMLQLQYMHFNTVSWIILFFFEIRIHTHSAFFSCKFYSKFFTIQLTINIYHWINCASNLYLFMCWYLINLLCLFLLFQTKEKSFTFFLHFNAIPFQFVYISFVETNIFR